jgi:hypothetical protein
MKKPNTLTQFLEEIQGEAIVSVVETNKESKLIVYVDENAADAEDDITISAEDTKLILANAALIERFFESLGSPKSASIVICDTVLPEKSLDALEKHFIAVDEA